jgi:FdhD protein
VNAPVASTRIWKISPEGCAPGEDLVAREEPLAIRLGYSTEHGREQRELAVTMRTPGEDLALALGFLLCEGVIRGISDVASIRHCSAAEPQASTENLLKVELTENCPVPAHIFKRHSFISSSCGVCGKASMDAIHLHRPSCAGATDNTPNWQVPAPLLQRLPETLLEKQRVFGATGGLHACGLFDLDGSLLALHEDVGRHNALDKLIGTALHGNLLPLRMHILLLSGRASFELLQKAAMAGLQLVCAVGAPSSLAVECAAEFGITLVGFLRKNRCNVYSHPHRIEGVDASTVSANPCSQS